MSSSLHCVIYKINKKVVQTQSTQRHYQNAYENDSKVVYLSDLAIVWRPFFADGHLKTKLVKKY